MAERVFFDGDCGLCHHTVRFLLRADPDGEVFRFAPLGGETFEREVAPRLENVPDAVIVLTADGRILTRSDATVRLFLQLGGVYGWLGTLLGWIPRPLRDAAYDALARVRHRLFARPEAACPVMAPELRARFEP